MTHGMRCKTISSRMVLLLLAVTVCVTALGVVTAESGVGGDRWSLQEHYEYDRDGNVLEFGSVPVKSGVVSVISYDLLLAGCTSDVSIGLSMQVCWLVANGSLLTGVSRLGVSGIILRPEQSAVEYISLREWLPSWLVANGILFTDGGGLGVPNNALRSKKLVESIPLREQLPARIPIAGEVVFTDGSRFGISSSTLQPEQHTVGSVSLREQSLALTNGMLFTDGGGFSVFSSTLQSRKLVENIPLRGQLPARTPIVSEMVFTDGGGFSVSSSTLQSRKLVENILSRERLPARTPMASGMVFTDGGGFSVSSMLQSEQLTVKNLSFCQLRTLRRSTSCLELLV